MMFDLDHFKRINDELGHSFGDLAIVTASDVFRKNIRTSDLIYRYCGEEFALALQGADGAVAFTCAERGRNELAVLGIGAFLGSSRLGRIRSKLIL